LNCIIKPTDGIATVNGYDILKQETEVKRITGLLAEAPGLYEKLSSYEFLEFMGALYDVPTNILSGRIDDLLKLFGLYDRRDYLLEGYSRGMKHKIISIMIISICVTSILEVIASETKSFETQ